MGLRFLVVNIKWRRMRDENIKGAAITNSIPQQTGHQLNDPAVSLGLGILIDAIGMITDGTAKTGQQESFGTRTLQVEIGTAFGARGGESWIVLRIASAQHIIQGYVQYRN